ncbi:response regulator [Maribacter algicola]|uniref:Response regulator n=1 Tax=Meishania litoralis TaxID=3434685 RepID=A0ACC7LMM7_9FLAO
MISSTDEFVNDQKIYTDRLGRIWSIVGNRPLAIYDKESDSFDDINAIDKAKCMIQAKNGNYFIGTVGNGLYSINQKTKDTLQLLKRQEIPEQIFEIIEYKENIFASTTNGIAKSENGKFSWLKIPSQNPNGYSAITSSEEHGVWLGTRKNGLYKLNGSESGIEKFEGFEHYSFSDDLEIVDLLFDSDHSLWVSTNGQGVFLIDLKKEKINHLTNNKYDNNSLLSNKTLMLYEDSHKGIWITNTRGISLYDPFLFKFNRLTQNELPHDLTMSTITEIQKDSEGHIWLASMESGIFKIDGTTGDITSFNNENCGLTGNGILSMEFIGKELWVSNTDSEIQVMNYDQNGVLKNVGTKKVLNSWVEKIKKDSENNIWLQIANNGLVKYDPESTIPPVIRIEAENINTFPSKKIFDFKEGNNKKMWIVGDEGLFSYDLRSSKIEHYDLDLNNYSKILPFEDNTLWIWNHNSGLLRYDPEKNKTTLKYDFIPEFTVQSINHHNEWFWLASSQGIIKIPERTGELFKYDDQQDLQSLEFTFANYWDNETQTLYLGGKEGINWFKPDEITENPYAPETAIDKINLFNNPIDGTVRTDFEYDQNSFTFEISALQFSSHDKNKFKHRLLNYDADWVHSQNKSLIRYSNLPPGKYEFQALSGNYDNIWDLTPATYKFEIKNPWYLSKTARVTYGIAFLLLIFLIYQYFYSKWELQSKLKIEFQRSEHLKELDKLKNRLYINISHEFRTPLTLISGPIERQLQNPDNPEGLKNDLQLVDKSTKRLLKLVDQLLDLAKLESGNLNIRAKEVQISSFFKQIMSLFEYQAKQKKINFEWHSNGLGKAWIDLDVLEKIAGNLLSNAFKYTPIDGTILCQVKTVDDQLILIVMNNGVSISQEEIPKLFRRYYQKESTKDGSGIGLSLVKELVQLSHGTVKAELIVNGHIQFTVKLPISKHAYDQHEIEEHSSSLVTSTPFTNHKNDDTPSVPNTEKPVLLIVEDDEDIRSFLKSLFKERYKIKECTNGEDGFASALKLVPDIILSDIMMPKLDGEKMTKKLKNHELTSHIPIILLTAKSGNPNEISGLRSGADDYITKPFKVEVLNLKMENLMRLRNNIKLKYRQGFVLKDIPFSDMDEAFLKRLQQILDENIMNPQLSSKDLAKKMNVSRTQLHRKLKALAGRSTTEFIRNNRLQLAIKLLVDSRLTIKEIAYNVGFNTPSYFVTSFKKDLGVTPSTYREQHRRS